MTPLSRERALIGNYARQALIRFRKSLIQIDEDDGLYRARMLGQSWFIPVNDRGTALWAFRFMKVQDRYLELVRSGDIVIDVGACTGEYAVPAARRVGPTGHVYAFEAAPGPFRCLERNAANAKLKNITAVNMAVSNKREKAKAFFDIPCTIAGGSLHYRHSAESEVNTVTLDAYFENRVPHVGVLKIAVNGYEPQVIEGASTILPNTRHVVFQSAFHESVIRLLVGAGFEMSKSVPRGEDSEGRAVRVVLMERTHS